MSILHGLVQSGNNIERLRQLLQNRGNVNATDVIGNTPLHIVASKIRTNRQDIEDSVSMARVLIEFGAEINKTNEGKYTPLLLAVSSGNCRLVEFLLEKEANVRAVDKNFDTALHLAIRRGPIRYTNTPIWNEHYATRKPVLKMVKTLLTRNPDINARNWIHETPVLLAVKYQDFPVLKELLDRAASALLPDRSENTNLYYAVNRQQVNLDIVMELLRHCAKFYRPVTLGGLVPMDFFLSWLNIADVAEVERAKSVFRGFLLGTESLKSDHETNIKEISRLKGIELAQLIDRCKIEINDMKQDELADECSVLDMARCGFFFTTEKQKHDNSNVFDELMDKLKKSEYPVYHEILVRSISRPHLTEKFSVASVNVKSTGISFLDAYPARYACSYLSHLDMFNCIVAFTVHQINFNVFVI